MKKNTASQVVVAQLVSKTDGSAVTSGTTTVYVLGDGGTQATGSVGSGAGTHEGNGVWSYAPAQAETNYDHVAFTFVNSTAVNATVQVYTSFPQTGDGYARLGAPAGASHAADVAAVKAVLPAALVSGRIDASVGAMASGVLTATAIAADAITDAKVASDVTIASVTGAVGSVTGNVGGNVTGSVGSVVARVTANTDQLAGQTVTAAAGVTFPTSVASPTNITAGTITTVTNLTNAPSAGDFTATMKTSIGTAVAASAVASVTGNVGGNVTGSVGSVVGAVGSVTADVGITQTAADKVWASAARTLTSFGTLAADAATAVWAATTRLLTAGTNIVLAKGTGVTGFNDLSAAQVNAEVDTAISDAALATAANLATVDTVVDAIQVVTDKLDTAMEADVGVYRFTTNALEQAPTGGSAPTASAIADEVQTRTIAAVTVVNGLAANVVTAASLAADAGSEIATAVRTNLATELAHMDADVSSRLATAGYTAPDNTGIAAIKTKTDQLTFGVANAVNANITYVNETAVAGTGALGDEWGPA